MIYDLGLSANNQATYYKLGADIYLNDISNYDKWGTKNFDMSVLNNWYENESYFNSYYDSKLTPSNYSFFFKGIPFMPPDFIIGGVTNIAFDCPAG